jgi:hypothetical protein
MQKVLGVDQSKKYIYTLLLPQMLISGSQIVVAGGDLK